MNTETINGTDVYMHKVFLLADEYVKAQLNGNEEKVTEYFRDMIFFISDRLERPDNSDIEALDNLFNAYVRLCTRYRKLPTLECYSWLVKINRATFTDWSNGEYRSSTAHGNTVKKWLNICKGFAVDELSNSKYANPNLIFTAKAAYGMRETAPVPAIETEKKSVLSVDELPKLCVLEEENIVSDLPQLNDKDSGVTTNPLSE